MSRRHHNFHSFAKVPPALAVRDVTSSPTPFRVVIKLLRHLNLSSSGWSQQRMDASIRSCHSWRNISFVEDVFKDLDHRTIASMGFSAKHGLSFFSYERYDMVYFDCCWWRQIHQMVICKILRIYIVFLVLRNRDLRVTGILSLDIACWWWFPTFYVSWLSGSTRSDTLDSIASVSMFDLAFAYLSFCGCR